MWQGFCEHLKECGRNGAPFCFALAAVLGMGALGTWGVAMFLAVLAIGISVVWAFIADQRQKFEKLGKMPPLSENELNRARSKLVSCRTKR
jgi:hypothetical protein